MAKLESDFKARVVKHIREELLPGCILTTGNSASQQGIPDVFIVYGNKWAMLEFKREANSARQPNQDYFVDMLNDWSFAAFIYPENEEEVLDALQSTFRSRRSTRLPQR